MKLGRDGIQRVCVAEPMSQAIIAEAHEGLAGGHFGANITLHKILMARYWWPTMQKDVYNFCRSCDICQRTSKRTQRGANPLNPIMPTEVFQRWGLDFIGPISPATRFTQESIYPYQLPITLPSGLKPEHLRTIRPNLQQSFFGRKSLPSLAVLSNWSVTKVVIS